MSAKSVIVAQDVTVTPSQKVKGFLDWGENNIFPHKLIRMVNKSPTAKTCVKRRSQFIAGNGILDRALSNITVNRHGQTLDALHRASSQNLGFGEVVAFHIGYNGNLDVNSIQVIPFENFRYAAQDSYGNVNAGGIFPYLQSSLVKNAETKHTRCQLFNPDKEVIYKEVVRAGGIERYNGQILYIPMLTTGDVFYHRPDWFTSNIAIQTEPALLDYDYKQTVNNFAPAGFYETYEEPAFTPPLVGAIQKPTVEDGVIIPDLSALSFESVLPGETNVGKGKEDEDSIEAQFAASIGNRNAGSVIFVRHKTKDAMLLSKFNPITGAQLSERNGSLNDRNPVTIARAFEVPLQLINIKGGGTLSSTGLEVEAAVNLMFQTVNDYQRVHRLALEYILRYWHQPLGDISCETEQLNYFKYKSDPDANNGNAPSAG